MINWVKKMLNKLKQMTKNNKKDFVKLVFLILIVVAFTIVTIYLMPWIISLKDEKVRNALKVDIYSKGALGVLMLLGLQVLQVVVAFIPGEPIEVISGLMYGTFYGYIICTVGMLIDTVLIYYTVKSLGDSFINKLIGEDKLSKYKFLHDEKKLEMITFILFFIPGTPKDLLTYFMPLTKMKPMTFFMITTFARIPSIISSTYAGASISQGKWMQTVVVFLAIGAIGILGIIFNDRFMKSVEKKRQAIKSKFNNK